MLELNKEEADLIKQWFNAVQDLNEPYLTESDYNLAKKVYGYLEIRMSKSKSTHN